MIDSDPVGIISFNSLVDDGKGVHVSVSTTTTLQRTPASLTTELMAAWRRGDTNALRALIHPDTELQTPLMPLVGLTTGREHAVQLLLQLREDKMFSLDVDWVEEDSPTKGTVHARSRRRTTPRGFADGSITWHIELRDGMLWRSRLV